MVYNALIYAKNIRVIKAIITILLLSLVIYGVRLVIKNSESQKFDTSLHIPSYASIDINSDSYPLREHWINDIDIFSQDIKKADQNKTYQLSPQHSPLAILNENSSQRLLNDLRDDDVLLASLLADNAQPKDIREHIVKMLIDIGKKEILFGLIAQSSEVNEDIKLHIIMSLASSAETLSDANKIIMASDHNDRLYMTSFYGLILSKSFKDKTVLFDRIITQLDQIEINSPASKELRHRLGAVSVLIGLNTESRDLANEYINEKMITLVDSSSEKDVNSHGLQFFQSYINGY